MLKALFYLSVFCLLFLIACSGNKKNTQKNDTVFLVNVSNKDWGQKTFIEKNRNAAEYKSLLNFKFDSNLTAAFIESTRDLKQHYPSSLKKFNIGNIPREWVPIHQYKNKYYLYSAAESDLEGRLIVTDTTLIRQWGYDDGPIAQPLLSVKKTAKNTWLLKTDAYYQSPPNAETLIIHTIDRSTNLAVWEEFSKLRGHNYWLCVPRDNADKFDMIVNRSDGRSKIGEFIFDKIDYQKLLITNR